MRIPVPPEFYDLTSRRSCCACLAHQVAREYVQGLIGSIAHSLRRAFLVGTVIAIAGGSATACRYNVRDIGFVELNQPRYELSLRGPLSEPSRESLFAVFNESNVRIKVSSTEELRNAGIEGDGAHASLKDPEGRTIRIAYDPLETAGDAARACNFDRAAPLIDRLLSSHSVILLVEGADKSENLNIRRWIERVIESIMATEDLWPKPITNPPAVVSIALADRPDHNVLLWSLGFNSQAVKPQVAVLIGRGRRLGGVLRGEQLTSAKLESLLQLVSVDCECGLNLEALVGPSIPHQWTPDHDRRAVAELAFDPGSPLVQVEVEQIRLKWRSRSGSEAGIVELSDPSFGYREILLPPVEGDATEIPERQSDSEATETSVLEQGPRQESVGEELSTRSGSPFFWPLLWSLTAVALASLMCSLLIAWRRGW